MTVAPPTFLVIGAGKAGTTTLHHMLGTLSRVYMSELKEPHYFSMPESPDYPVSWYCETFFADGADHEHRAESSNSYTMFPIVRSVPERLHRMNPDLRFVYIARDPVERMVSAYAERRRMGFEYRPIEVALATDLAYSAPSMYAMQLREYLRWFDRAQIHMELLDDLRADAHGVLARIARFLGIPNDGHPVSAKNASTNRAVRRSYAPLLTAFRSRGLHRRRWQQRLMRSRVGSRSLAPAELRIDEALDRQLRRLFVSDIGDLETLVSRSFSHWVETGT